MRIQSLTLVLTVFLLGGCQLMMRKAVGMKVLKNRDKKEIDRFANRFGIPPQCSYELNAKSFFNSLTSEQQKDTAFLNNIGQPAQVRIFHRDTCRSYVYFCNVSSKGLNVDWASTGLFDRFPPRVEVQALHDVYDPPYLMRLSEEMPHFYPGYTAPPDGKHVMLVFWSVFGGRQSRNLIELTERYRSKYENQGLSVMYVNIDDFIYLLTEGLKTD